MSTKILPRFGALGHGYDVTSASVRDPVLRCALDTTAVSKEFRFRGHQYAIPEGVLVDPTPRRHGSEEGDVSVCKDIHDYQSALANSMGLGIDSFGEFARSASVTGHEHLFTGGANYVIRARDLISFFSMSVHGLDADLTLPSFMEAVRACEKDSDWMSLFHRYGTHLVRSGDVGGYLSLETVVNASSMTQSTLSDASLRQQAKVELDGITGSSDSSIDARSSRATEEYRMNSHRTHEILGGNPAAETYGEWLASLEDADLPQLGDPVTSGKAPPDAGLMVVPSTTDSGGKVSQVLAFVNMHLEPLANYLPEGAQRSEMARRAKEYIEANRIDAPPRQRMTPHLPGHGKIHRMAPGAYYHFGAQAFEKTDVRFGLEAVPGTRASVTVDHNLVESRDYTIWPGQVLSRDKFYGAGRVQIWFNCDDPDARLLVRHW